MPDAWYYQPETVSRYESWYTGPKGERMDRLEKTVLRQLLADAGWLGTEVALLEVGCGTCHFTRWFAAQVGRAVGADLSPLMLRESRRWWDGPVVCASSRHLPFRTGAFDVAVMIACFEYMPDPVGVLQEAARVARRGLLLGLMNRRSVAGARRRVQQLLGRNDFYRGAHFYTLGEIRSLVRAAFPGGAKITWRYTLYPPGVPLGVSRVPGGSFLAVRVDFAAPGVASGGEGSASGA